MKPSVPPQPDDQQPLRELAVGEAVTMSPRLNLAVASWLGEYDAAPLTRTSYTAELQCFVATLQRGNLALDSTPGLVAIVARTHANRGNVRATSFNKRLSTLSSFYRHAIRHDLVDINPIDTIKRRCVKRYAQSQALDVGDVKRRLAQIDRTTLAGLRDYALLSVALITGRRRAELAGLRAGHVQPRSDGRVRLTWVKVKASEDPMYDTLPLTVSTLLLSYLHRVYSARLGDLPHDAAVWVSVSNNHAGGALHERALTDICQARLGTTSVQRRAEACQCHRKARAA